MKKLWTLALAAGLLALSGCSDAVAEISNGSEVVFSVGDRSVTREDMFTTYKSSGASYIIQEATRYIVDQEVETTEEMEKQAQEELDNFKNTYGDQSESYIKLGGYQDENDYRDRYLLLNIKTKQLPYVFIKDNFKSQAEKYHPMKVQILETTELGNAQSALEAIKNGGDFEENVTAYGDTTNFKGEAEIITSQTTPLPESIFEQLKKNTKSDYLFDEVLSDTTTGKYYVIRVIHADPNDFKEEAIEAMASISTMQTTAFTHYLKKYDFRIYDIDIYQDINESQPDYIVQ